MKLSKWTKHSDWQPIPKWFSNNLPVCPICKERTKWEVYDKWGWTMRGYRIICSLCGAEWESTVVKATAKSVLLGPVLSGDLSKALSFPKDDSIMILRKVGSNPKKDVSAFLDKELTLSAWKQMAGPFCGKCGNPLAYDEKFCSKCGAKRE